MKNINLIFLGIDNNSKFQPYVLISDNNNIIFKGYSSNGKIRLCLKNNHGYRICIKLYNNFINTSFYVSNSYNNYYFNLNTSYRRSRNITFILRDYYYNLLINKGELILWQKM